MEGGEPGIGSRVHGEAIGLNMFEPLVMMNLPLYRWCLNHILPTQPVVHSNESGLPRLLGCPISDPLLKVSLLVGSMDT